MCINDVCLLCMNLGVLLEKDVLHNLDEDLLYGFDLSITEETLYNFGKLVPPEGVFFDEMYEQYEESRDARQKEILKLWKSKENCKLKQWRLCAEVMENETSEQFEKRKQKNNYTSTDLESSIDNLFDEHVSADSPHLAFEYQARVRDLQMQIMSPSCIVNEDNKWTTQVKKNEDWEFRKTPTTAFEDSGLMLKFYAEWERSDLLKNLGTSSYFNYELPYEDSDPKKTIGPVNPWTWMRWWLTGEIDGVKWLQVLKRRQDSLKTIWEQKGNNFLENTDDLEVNGVVRAKFPGTEHFLIGRIQDLKGNGLDGQCTVVFDRETQGSLVDKKFIFKIRDPKQFNANKSGNVHTWYTNHMLGINRELKRSMCRFTTITELKNLMPIDFLVMLMMDAFREEICRQCQMQMYAQWNDLRIWFDNKFESTVIKDQDEESVNIKERTRDFLKFRYKWHQDTKLLQLAVDDIDMRVRNARKLLGNFEKRALEFETSKKIVSGDVNEHGVFQLIDNVIGTFRGYNLIPTRAQTLEFPYAWPASQKEMITLELLDKLRSGEKFEVKALHRMGADASYQDKCELAIVTAMHEFKRVTGSDNFENLYLHEPPAIQFDGFSELHGIQIGDAHATSRVKHGEYTYDVEYKDTRQKAFNLHPSMLAPVWYEAPQKDELGKLVDELKNAFIEKMCTFIRTGGEQEQFKKVSEILTAEYGGDRGLERWVTESFENVLKVEGLTWIQYEGKYTEENVDDSVLLNTLLQSKEKLQLLAKQKEDEKKDKKKTKETNKDKQDNDKNKRDEKNRDTPNKKKEENKINDFFTFCNNWLWLKNNINKTTFTLLSDKVPVQVYISKRISKEDVKQERLIEMIRIGINFAKHFGSKIPTPTDADAGIRDSLGEDLKKFTESYTFSELVITYNLKENQPFNELNAPQVAWMLGLFPNSPTEVNERLKADRSVFLNSYREQMTIEQCAWLQYDLVNFCVDGGLRTSDLMKPGAYPFQENILAVMHRSADDHNYHKVQTCKFTLAEAVWLSLHASDTAEYNDTDEFFDAMWKKVKAHCRYEYGRIKEQADRDKYQNQLNHCKTPGQMLLGSHANLAMPSTQYPYHARPLFPRVTSGIGRLVTLSNSIEVTKPIELKKAKPSPYDALVQVMHEANCDLVDRKDPREHDYAVLYPTRRPWTASRGLAIRALFVQKCMHKWPAQWYALRDRVPVHVWMEIPSCVSSVYYFKHTHSTSKQHKGGGDKGGVGKGGIGFRKQKPPRPPPERPVSPGEQLKWPKFKVLRQAKTIHGAYGGLKNGGNRCWFNSLCQFIFRGELGKNIMERIREILTLFRIVLNKPIGIQSELIKKDAFECSEKTNEDRRFAEMPHLRSYDTWVWFITWKNIKQKKWTVDDLIDSLLKDTTFLTYMCMEIMHDAYLKINESKSKSLDVHELLCVLSHLKNVFSNCDMQDSGEALIELRTLVIEFQCSDDTPFFMKTNVIDPFEHMLSTSQQSIRCSRCDTVTLQDKESYQLKEIDTMHLTEKTPLSGLLAPLQYSVMEDVANSFYCDSCKDKVPSALKSVTWEYSDFICVHEKTEVFDRVKNKGIKSPNAMNLDIEDEIQVDGEKYRLVGLLQHQGLTSKSGHYIAFVKSNDEWYEYNDSTVRRSNLEEVIRQRIMKSTAETALLILYERIKKESEVKEIEEEELRGSDKEADENPEEKDGNEEEGQKKKEELKGKKDEMGNTNKGDTLVEEAVRKDIEEGPQKQDIKKVHGGAKEVDYQKDSKEEDKAPEYTTRIKNTRGSETEVNVVFGRIDQMRGADAVVSPAENLSFSERESGISEGLKNLMYTDDQLSNEERTRQNRDVIGVRKQVYENGIPMIELPFVKDHTAGVQMTMGRLKSKFKYVIHAVGPCFRDVGKEEMQLKTTINNAFHAAAAVKASSVVFCVISSGYQLQSENEIDEVDKLKQNITDRKVLVDSIVDYIKDEQRKHVLLRIDIFEYDNPDPKMKAQDMMKKTIEFLKTRKNSLPPKQKIPQELQKIPEKIVRMPWIHPEWKSKLADLPTNNEMLMTWINSHTALQEHYSSCSRTEKYTLGVTLMDLAEKVKENKIIIPNIAIQSKGLIQEQKLTDEQIKMLISFSFFGFFSDNFSLVHILNNENPRSLEKLRCILNYLQNALNTPGPQRVISFKRTNKEFDVNLWKNSSAVVLEVKTHNIAEKNGVSEKINIEDICDQLDEKGGCWEVDFANKGVGGGVIGYGAVQEEIRFLQCPELIVCQLFMGLLEDNECVHITGYKQFNDTQGYGILPNKNRKEEDLFAWKSDHKEKTLKQERRMIVMDAIEFAYRERWKQFNMRDINRELHKAYVAFSTGDERPISTGHWGGGAFNGDKKLKAVIQIMAAGMAGKELHYCLWDDMAEEVGGLIGDITPGTSISALYTALETAIRTQGRLGGFSHESNRNSVFAALRAVCTKKQDAGGKASDVVEIKQKREPHREEVEVKRGAVPEEIVSHPPVAPLKKVVTNWFNRVFGFDEETEGEDKFVRNKAKFKLNTNTQGEYLLQWNSGGKTHEKFVGLFETPTFSDLKAQFESLKYMKGKKVEYDVADKHGMKGVNEKDNDEELDLLFFDHVYECNVRDLILFPGTPSDSVFMVASQFNALEMIDPDKTPSDGVTCYAQDKTQGPACAMACPYATVFRNYFCPNIDLMKDINVSVQNRKKRYYHIQNGYLFPTSQDAYIRMENHIKDNLLGKEIENNIRVGVQWSTEVAPPGTHRVTQVFCSALPISYWRDKGIDISYTKQHHRLAIAVLRGAFKATLAVAALRANTLKKERVKVYLSALGGGVFGTDPRWISQALTSALYEFRRAPLDVTLVHIDQELFVDRNYTMIHTGTFSRRVALSAREEYQESKETFQEKYTKTKKKKIRKCSICDQVDDSEKYICRSSDPRVYACIKCIQQDIEQDIFDFD